MANKQRKQPKYSNPDPMSNVRDMGRYGIRVIRDIAKGKFNFYNEGHIFIKMTNDTNENKTVEVLAGQGVAQGIFVQYGIVEDDDASEIRNGGFGSTTK